MFSSFSDDHRQWYYGDATVHIYWWICTLALFQQRMEFPDRETQGIIYKIEAVAAQPY